MSSFCRIPALGCFELPDRVCAGLGFALRQCRIWNSSFASLGGHSLWNTTAFHHARLLQITAAEENLKSRTSYDAPTGHKLFNFVFNIPSIAPVGAHLTFGRELIMYIPPKFKIDDPAVIRSFIGENSFALLLSLSGADIHDTHTPFVYSDEGHLLGHIAKANPQWKSWNKESKAKVIFTGPHSYISPDYYVSEFAVPTWNYTAVSITGHIKIIEEEDLVLQFLDRLISDNETSNSPWVLDRTDQRYMKLLSGIIVFSVSIDSVEASFKMNQKKSKEDQFKVVDSLSITGCPFDRDVANIISQNITEAEQGGASDGDNVRV